MTKDVPRRKVRRVVTVTLSERDFEDLQQLAARLGPMTTVSTLAGAAVAEGLRELQRKHGSK